jgi:hypothetical protein
MLISLHRAILVFGHSLKWRRPTVTYVALSVNGWAVNAEKHEPHCKPCYLLGNLFLFSFILWLPQQCTLVQSIVMPVTFHLAVLSSSETLSWRGDLVEVRLPGDPETLGALCVWPTEADASWLITNCTTTWEEPIYTFAFESLLPLPQVNVNGRTIKKHLYCAESLWGLSRSSAMWLSWPRMPMATTLLGASEGKGSFLCLMYLIILIVLPVNLPTCQIRFSLAEQSDPSIAMPVHPAFRLFSTCWSMAARKTSSVIGLRLGLDLAHAITYTSCGVLWALELFSVFCRGNNRVSYAWRKR